VTAPPCPPASTTPIELLAARLRGRPAAGHRVYLALKLQRPLFLEGEPGTGKTEIAKDAGRVLDRR
jgi:MoxR-like ATPase